MSAQLSYLRPRSLGCLRSEGGLPARAEDVWGKVHSLLEKERLAAKADHRLLVLETGVGPDATGRPVVEAGIEVSPGCDEDLERAGLSAQNLCGGVYVVETVIGSPKSMLDEVASGMEGWAASVNTIVDPTRPLIFKVLDNAKEIDPGSVRYSVCVPVLPCFSRGRSPDFHSWSISHVV